MTGGKPAGAADAALRFLARRDHTCLEMSQRLLAKGYTAAEVDEVLQRLRDWGYLDDRAVAARAVEACCERRPRGRRLLEEELLARGIAAPFVMEALAAFPPVREEEAAKAALARLGFGLPLRVGDRVRAWRTLVRLGFTEPIVERICGLPDA